MRQTARPFQYVTVAVVCAALNNAVLIAVSWAGFSLGIGLLSSFAIVLPIGYLLHVNLHSQAQASLASFARYGFAMLSNLPISALLLWVLTAIVQLPVRLAAPTTTIALFVGNYLLVSRWVLIKATPVRGYCKEMVKP